MTLHPSFPYSDGKLKEADQILTINGQLLDQTVSHQQAIGILQSASERVELTVARGPIPQLASPAVSRTPSAASTLSANSSAVRIYSHTNVTNEKLALACPLANFEKRNCANRYVQGTWNSYTIGFKKKKLHTHATQSHVYTDTITCIHRDN